MAEQVYKLAQAANDISKTHNVNGIRNAVNKYYVENQKKVDCLMSSGMNLMTKNAPINVESVDYEFAHQRAGRLVNDVNDIALNDDNQNWSIHSCQISNDDSHPSILKVSLKFGVLLTLTIDSEYPLKPPRCHLHLTNEQSWYGENQQTWNAFKRNNPCISHDIIDIYDKVWSPSLTLHDVVHFCSIIVLGDDPSSVLKSYVQMHHNSKIQSMLQSNAMKDYLLRYTNPVCKCGAEMQQVNTRECYGNKYPFVICDGCQVICKKEYGFGKEIVYHCPNMQLQNIHPDGYDVCFDCVYKNHLRYRQFNALIISPLLEVDGIPVDSKDADQLEMMFKQLRYHNIIKLKDNETRKTNIKEAIDALYLQDTEKQSNINKVNVIVYTGHGNHINNQFLFYIADGQLSDVELKEWIYCAQNGKMEENGDKKAVEKGSDAIDGYAKCKQALGGIANDKITFHRQNTLILINACHSGGFKSLNQIKETVQKSGILQIAINDIADGMGFDVNAIINQDIFNVDVEQKNDVQDTLSTMKVIDDTLNELMNEISYNTHSALVISSCNKNETSTYFAPVSPFVEYLLDFFKQCYKEITAAVKPDEIICGYSQLSDTPIKLYQYIYQRGQTPHHETKIILSDAEWQQNVTVASKRGSDQFVLCPLYN